MKLLSISKLRGVSKEASKYVDMYSDIVVDGFENNDSPSETAKNIEYAIADAIEVS